MSRSLRIAQAIAWNVFAGVGSRIVGLIGTLVLARFIAPGEYGEVSVAAICAMTASQFSNLEVGQYVILKGKSDRGAAFLAAVIHLGLGAIALAVVLAWRDGLGPMLGAPSMGRFIPGFVLGTAIERIAHIPEKLLARDLRFRIIALTRGVGELTFTGLALLSAPAIGGMAIVIGYVGRALLIMVVFAAAANREWLAPVRLTWSNAVAMLRYSLPLAMANMTGFAAGKWDNLIISRLHGPGVAGAYNLSYNLSLTATGTLADQILDVLFPSFTSLAPEQRGGALSRALSCLALLVMPLAFGLAAVADTVVAALFPKSWAGIAPMLIVLSVQSAILPLTWTIQAFCRAEHRPGIVLASGLSKLVVLVGALLTVGRLGPLWACAAVDVAALCGFSVVWTSLRRAHRAQMWPTARGVLQALAACVPMLIVVPAVRMAGQHLWALSAAWSLVLEVAGGAAAYLVGAHLLAHGAFNDVLQLARQLVARRRALAIG